MPRAWKASGNDSSSVRHEGIPDGRSWQGSHNRWLNHVPSVWPLEEQCMHKWRYRLAARPSHGRALGSFGRVMGQKYGADRCAPAHRKRNTDARWGYIGEGVIGRLRRLRREATSCTPSGLGCAVEPARAQDSMQARVKQPAPRN